MMMRSRFLGLALVFASWFGVGWNLRAQEVDEPAEQTFAELTVPPGDPWYESTPRQRGPRSNPADGLVFKARVTPHWFGPDGQLWYRNDLAGGWKEFKRVEPARGEPRPAFDHNRLAAGLSKAAGKNYSGDRLPFGEIAFAGEPGAKESVRFRVDGTDWACDLSTYECSRRKSGEGDESPSKPKTRSEPETAVHLPPDPPRGPDRPGPSQGLRSPDRKWMAYVRDHNVVVVPDGRKEEIRLTNDGKEGFSYGRLGWSPDSKTLVAYRIEPGDRKEVYLVQSSPPGGGRARLRSRPYPLPGDRFTSYELNLFDIDSRRQMRPPVDRIDYDEPRLRWDHDGRHFGYEKIDRGHQRYRLIRVDSRNGEARTIIDEISPTFIWTAHRENVGLPTLTWLDDSGEVIHASEREGWRHIYLIDARTGAVKNAITKGPWVVRGIDHVDRTKRQVWFHASGREPNQDPYFVHYYRVNLDGTGLVSLTQGDGNHAVQFSPDRGFLIDTYSRVDMAPVHELRRAADGGLVCRLEQADISALEATGWHPPEVFTAKGRDGKTDIWGIVCRPKDFDPSKKYPVIESIYAGPQGSFVPKSFSAARRFTSLTDLGLIVVQVDGMGTANRSKAFHDVCWHNLKDAGFADRILWHQALAKKYPYYDLSRVGIYGVSAGGQNAAAGVLFHPEFYHVAVAGCGCHDNRMDKASWNEQWMGYPVGPWYAESSNIDNAHRLQGKLLLIVGEMDNNVPPESTMRFADALIRAGKDFEMLVVPNAGHGIGGFYGDRRMHEFFVRHLRPVDGKETSTHTTAKPASGATASPDLGELADEGSELRRAIELYEADRSSLMRAVPAPGDPARERRIRDFNDGWLHQLDRLDFDRIGHDGKVDYLLFRNYLAHELRQLDIRQHERPEWEPLISFGWPILELDADRRVLKPMDWGTVAGDLNTLAKQIDEARKKLERDAKPGNRSKPQADRAARLRAANHALAAEESLRNTLRTWFAFYDGYDPVFSWWMQEPYKAVDQALQAHSNALRQRFGATTSGAGGDGSGFRRRGAGRPAPSPTGGPGTPPSSGPREDGSDIVGTPIGRDALMAELAHEMIPYTPEELIDLARHELAWCEGEMKKAAREMGLGDDWHAALERVKTKHVAPGEQPAMIRELALEAVAYLDANNLVTIPPLCRESWRMTMMSPEQQQVNPFFLGGETIIVSYPTNTMLHDSKMMSMRGNNRHFARATVHHELIPGHHLQGYMASRHRSYRSLFRTPFSVEGWALYWELLLWDRGFAHSPEDRVGMLFWRMHRCARIIFSLSFHLGTMTPRECIDMLVNQVGHERDNATAEVRRSFNGSYSPLYQAAYLLGGMQLRALHRELVESGKMTERAFHDAVLRENVIPIEMIRVAVTDQPVGRDYKASWKFAGDKPGKDGDRR
ncbi:MAG: DUF885 family protein [Isosphaeraceae bacterium]